MLLLLVVLMAARFHCYRIIYYYYDDEVPVAVRFQIQFLYEALRILAVIAFIGSSCHNHDTRPDC